MIVNLYLMMQFENSFDRNLECVSKMNMGVDSTTLYYENLNKQMNTFLSERNPLLRFNELFRFGLDGTLVDIMVRCGALFIATNNIVSQLIFLEFDESTWILL